MGNCFHTPIDNSKIFTEIDAYYEPKNNLNHNVIINHNLNINNIKKYKQQQIYNDK